ncbi:Detected protein of unknown function [Hibiscus syriacus]|uniref:Uncharacterized protein n=1 Tax=Hibiscus syriacus TaxID=106335 RepID=A0A6A2WDU4_HIBSY|nr:Detected protein of unknown function [Hibiscus syriacus]
MGFVLRILAMISLPLKPWSTVESSPLLVVKLGLAKSLIDDDEKVTMIDFPLMNADDLMGNNKTIQEEPTSSFNEEDQVEENLQSSEAGRTCDPEVLMFQEEDDEQKGDEYETELVKSLAKQRRRAMAASRKGHKNTTSRNSYKDKGVVCPVPVILLHIDMHQLARF